MAASLIQNKSKREAVYMSNATTLFYIYTWDIFMYSTFDQNRFLFVYSQADLQIKKQFIINEKMRQCANKYK